MIFFVSLGFQRFVFAANWPTYFFAMKNIGALSEEQDFFSRLESFNDIKKAHDFLGNYPKILEKMKISTVNQSNFVNIFLLASDSLIFGKGIQLENREQWVPYGNHLSQFSDPRMHRNDAPFMYTVTALHFQQKERSIDPEELKKSLLSVSVIDESNYNTWSTCGFILKIPERNIYFTSNKDARLNNEAIKDKKILKDHLSFQNYSKGLIGPKALIKDTPDYAYNELGVMGTNDLGQHIEIQGIFTRKPSNKYKENICNQKTIKNLIDYAALNSLPHIELIADN